MSSCTLTTPVALLVFNRPAETASVFAAIREARPAQLLVVADGPRLDRPGESMRCAEVRRIVEQVNWPCEVMHNYSDVNLGCRQRIASGLDWVFDQVEEAIILEDDCLPDPSFFRFCQELLAFYRHDERIMMLCGTNLLGRWKNTTQSYHFSHYDWVWGWASWRRAWRYYDVNMEQWGVDASKKQIRELLMNEQYYSLRAETFQQAYCKQVNTWDYQWAFARMLQGGLAIIPSENLVSNIGYGVDATHTKVHDAELAALPHGKLAFPLTHQMSFVADMDFDMAVVNMIRQKNALFSRIVRFCRLLNMSIFKKSANRSVDAHYRKAKDAT